MKTNNVIKLVICAKCNVLKIKARIRTREVTIIVEWIGVCVLAFTTPKYSGNQFLPLFLFWL